MLRISFLTDNPDSWIIPFVNNLEKIVSRRHQVARCFKFEDIPIGEISFFLSCERIVPAYILKRNAHNIVVHPSDIPLGRGFSPLSYQILEGKNIIPICLFEAAEKVDSGQVYYRDYINLEGHELNSETKELQGRKTIQMILRFLDDYPNVTGKIQQGESSFYKRRTAKDSKLDTKKSIAEQFDLLRIVDNERYPAFFCYRGTEFIIKIYKKEK